MISKLLHIKAAIFFVLAFIGLFLIATSPIDLAIRIIAASIGLISCITIVIIYNTYRKEGRYGK